MMTDQPLPSRYRVISLNRKDEFSISDYFSKDIQGKIIYSTDMILKGRGGNTYSGHATLTTPVKMTKNHTYPPGSKVYFWSIRLKKVENK